MITDQEVVLRPARGVAGRWAVAALAASAVFVWTLVDSGGHPLAIVAVTFSVVVGGYFALQVAWPAGFEVTLGPTELRARFLTATARFPWEQIHIARVGSLAGEPHLELHIREPSATGDPWRTRRTGVLLPTGCDLELLHRTLADRLGRGTLRPPRTVAPIELDEKDPDEHRGR
ncbi:MAG: hypothetical protein R3343_03275 [Nitriliruptorales bacterium]|nr:hypothetical protein [Nitriliruptorales bacterium]